MGDNKLETSIIPVLRAAREHDWRVITLDQPEDLDVDGYLLQITRGQFLLEVIAAEGLTDDVVLSNVTLDQFIRLADVQELEKIAQLSHADVEALWHRRSKDWRGRDGEPVLNEIGQAGPKEE